MTVKLVVLYTTPPDADAFDSHYTQVHGPLVDAVPGLLRWDTSLFVGAPDGGEQSYHRMAQLYFEDAAALEAGLGSPEGAAAARDFGEIAPPGSRMFVATAD